MVARAPVNLAFELKLAVVAGQYPLISETFVRHEVRMLRERGCAVTTLGLHACDERVPSDGGQERADAVVYEKRLRLTGRLAVELARFPWRSMRTIGRVVRDAWTARDVGGMRGRLKVIGQGVAGLAAARQLRPTGVQHVHCHFAHAPATVGMYAAMQLGVGFSFTGHANDLFQRRSLLAVKLNRARFVGCISDWHRELYRSICPDAAHRYRLVRCGIEMNRWNGRTKPAELHRPVRLLSVGRLVPKKGVGTLIRALAQLSEQQDGGWRLTVVGEGPQREQLEQLARRLGVDGWIDWRGAMENEQLPELFAEHDLFALCCRTDAQDDRDGVPVVLMEAMAAGLPVVAGDLPAIRELVIDRQTGLLVDGRMPDEVAGALRALAEDAGLRGALSGQARRWVRDEFSAQRNVNRLMEAITDAPQSPTAPSPPSAASGGRPRYAPTPAGLTHHPLNPERAPERGTVDSP